MDEDSVYKDLDKLGRDLSKTIMVDNSPLMFKYNHTNGLFIKTWKGDEKDIQLKGLARMLIDITDIGVADVRDIIKLIHKEYPFDKIKEMENPYRDVDLSLIWSNRKI
jgi:TFIIF-interacting CTD phosphatase-like protein